MTQAIIQGGTVFYLLSDTAILIGSTVTDGSHVFTMSDVQSPVLIPAADVSVPADAAPSMCAYQAGRVTAPGYAAALAGAIATKLQALEAFALVYEQGGTTVGGIHIDTDDRTQAKLTAAYNLAQTASSPATFSWWMSTGWASFTKAQITTIAPAVGLWVEQVFANLGVHFANIQALTSITAVQAYDFTTGWPKGT